ncbi:TetR/AcrR family transcriptional regulator [Nocardia sp. CA2R105]|uniref:TetR/AcrR family transcriptional regulator n=1 Tax=Nocardia coffeae TaxID=2873381 RepID=UPI001CA7394F|nr:TetR/AcrR family transcriptional regulator [Nocardia coffeae]MBY8863380.1 TetR/AcrR family transcriptional regulator [Nocardia coffeae]
MLGDNQTRTRMGRPRDPSKDAAVLEATINLLAQVGLAGISIDRVAADAGVSKVTVYSRWANKEHLIAAALSHVQVTGLPEPTGSARTDLIAHLKAMHQAYDESRGMAILGNCLASEPASGELLDSIRRSTILPRRAGFAEVVRAGIERGELRSDIDPERVTSMIIGVLYADHVAGLSLDRGWEESVVDDVLAGAARRD